jgi:hypothetical protein
MITLTIVRETNTSMQASVQFAVMIYDCNPTGFALSAPSISLELNSTANTLTWSFNAVNPLCGTYTVTSDTTKISNAVPSSLVVDTSTAGSYTATLTLTRDSNTAMMATTSLPVSIQNCQPSGFTLSLTSVMLEINSSAPAITWTADAKDTLCGTYSITSDSTIVTISGQNLALQTAAATVQTVTLKLIRDVN